MRADASHVVVRPLLSLKASYGIQCSRYIYWAMTPTTSSISFNADGSLDVIKAVVFAHLVHSDNNLGSNTKGRKDTRRGLSVFFYLLALLSQESALLSGMRPSISLRLFHTFRLPRSLSPSLPVDAKMGMLVFQSLPAPTQTAPVNSKS